MPIIKLMGGLGNQIFQYAFGCRMLSGNIHTISYDICGFRRDQQRTYKLSEFGLNLKIEPLISGAFFSALLRLHQDKFFRIFRERESYIYEVYPVDQDGYYVGSWQNTRYFKQVKNKISSELWLVNPSPELRRITELISETESVAVHVRRGDYLKASQYNILNVEYYKSAMAKLRDRVNHPTFFVFSDDIDWCKDNISHDSVVFVEGLRDTEDFQAMRKCKHYIIANSTFSWWPAWLAPETSIKIAPTTWFRDNATNTKVCEALLEDFTVL